MRTKEEIELARRYLMETAHEAKDTGDKDALVGSLMLAAAMDWVLKAETSGHFERMMDTFRKAEARDLARERAARN